MATADQLAATGFAAVVDSEFDMDSAPDADRAGPAVVAPATAAAAVVESVAAGAEIAAAFVVVVVAVAVAAPAAYAARAMR